VLLQHDDPKHVVAGSYPPSLAIDTKYSCVLTASHSLCTLSYVTILTCLVQDFQIISVPVL